ncbi:MmgE/PrpD family protein [Ureibacillus terrenus]|uniref:MmgE/PrpD family protein n=1 Tax=Ureibacillus terrenus TaxID=118246 RepID=A0A540V3L0_9BACL|nr:MmgE/PrpD family protein [Ureibacillus terrenus]TQE91335.1 MmgE/PrpD family protein [Ureibacillus terrenus]
MRSANRNGKTGKDFLDKLVAFIQETAYEELPENLKVLAKQAIIDTIGVSLAGWHEPAVEKVKSIYKDQQGDASLWGERTKAELERAAIINGTASHVLDYDDASPGVIIHPSAPILAAITPIAEHLKSSGKEVITAYAIGTEAMVRTGEVMGIRHYHSGWHATSTLGVIGAASACAYLQRLNGEQCKNAIAIAASLAGGLQKNFGSMVKPLHVGLAAAGAIQAVRLAGQDFTGNHEIFEERGFFHAFSDLDDDEIRSRKQAVQFGRPFDLPTGLSVKKYPCCFATHRFIHGALLLKNEHHLQIDQIDEIILKAQERSLLPLIHSRPKTGLEAKFSAEYTVLAALLDGYVRLSSFTDARVQRPEIQSRLPKVRVSKLEETVEDWKLNRRLPVEIQIRTKDGKVFETSVQHPPGSIEIPLSDEEHREKWSSCVAFFIGTESEEIEAAANEIYENGLKLEGYTHFGGWLHEMQEKLSDCKAGQSV